MDSESGIGSHTTNSVDAWTSFIDTQGRGVGVDASTWCCKEG